MWRNLFLSCLGAILIFSTGSDGSIAKATFSAENSGVSGYIMVDRNNAVYIKLNFSAVNTSLIPTNTSCLANGLKYHIHTKWTYQDNVDRVGASACGATFAGGHYDPWLACSSTTGNTDCAILGGCVLASTSYNETANSYACSSSVYPNNPYACEVGDWSSKYGTLYLTDLAVEEWHQSYWEVGAGDLIFENGTYNFSVVIHCNTGERAFCAPFSFSEDTTASTSLSTSNNSAYAVFSDAGSNYTNLNISFTESKWHFYVPTTAVDQCKYWYLYIHEQWNSSTDASASCTSDLIGNIWDPTHSCITNSSSPYCNNGVRCTNHTITYNCSHYTCAVGDVSGRIGTVDFTTMTPTSGFYDFTLTESIPVGIVLADDKSLRINCYNTNYVSDVCARIYYETVTTTTTTTSTTTSTTTTSTTTDSTTTSSTTTSTTTTNNGVSIYKGMELLFFILLCTILLL